MSTPPVDTYDYGDLRSVPPLSRLLWWCAGADAQLLVRCPSSDRVKFQGLGGVVLATGTLAFLSGSYAFYTVFSPKTGPALDAAAAGVHLPSFFGALLVGCVWALIIFNIERFIVSSTGKGDGTDAITLREFGQALPRIIMALIMGICLAVPLEIRILESEIEAQLQLDQLQFLDVLNKQASSNVSTRRAELVAEKAAIQTRLDDAEARFQTRRREINDQRRKLEDEIAGRSGSGIAGEGPAAKTARQNLDRMEIELDEDKAAAEKRSKGQSARLEEITQEVTKIDGGIARTESSNAAVAANQDGLLKRIQIAEKLSPTVVWMIRLLLLMIETGPIFFKMMVSKGAYDYLVENQMLVVRARAGIEPDARLLPVEGGHEEVIDLHHAVAAIEAEGRRRFETEQILAEELHHVFRERTRADIRQRPDDFMEQVLAVTERGERYAVPGFGAVAPELAPEPSPSSHVIPPEVESVGPEEPVSTEPSLSALPSLPGVPELSGEAPVSAGPADELAAAERLGDREPSPAVLMDLGPVVEDPPAVDESSEREPDTGGLT